MLTQPKYSESTASIGEGIKVSFKGENWGNGLKDTEVKINDAALCWIAWEDKGAFMEELNAVVEKYRI